MLIPNKDWNRKNPLKKKRDKENPKAVIEHWEGANCNVGKLAIEGIFTNGFYEF